MHIEWMKIRGFRNFENAHINFREQTLIIGGNDVGKTNLVHALRLLLDRSLSDMEIEPDELDFHVNPETGEQTGKIEILLKFVNIDKDAVLSKLKGAVSESSETYLKYEATKHNLEYRLYLGYTQNELEEIQSRSYLKYLNLRYIRSQRDLKNFIRSEKRSLLRLSQEMRQVDEIREDDEKLREVEEALEGINDKVRNLHYVKDATDAVNKELSRLAHHHKNYNVRLETGAIQVNQFIEKLELGADTGNTRIMPGGDGRNNQILMALWKAKSEREHDLENEEVLYCVEEPEAHLHPHQQRKLANYLTTALPGQAFITSHSPQIAASYRPNSIVRLVEKRGSSKAASNGCADCIEEAWKNMSYRMSILQAETFFADANLLVEGPSEVLFYHELAEQLGIDLDYYNISILSVEGVDFNVYIRILDALEIPWAVRTDNDVSKVPKSSPTKWQFAGLNRALSLVKASQYENSCALITSQTLKDNWAEASELLNPKGIFVSKHDLEQDIALVLPNELKQFAKTDDLENAVAYLQKRKAIRMSRFLSKYGESLSALSDDELAKPLLYCKEKVIELR